MKKALNEHNLTKKNTATPYRPMKSMRYSLMPDLIDYDCNRVKYNLKKDAKLTLVVRMVWI